MAVPYASLGAVYGREVNRDAYRTADPNEIFEYTGTGNWQWRVFRPDIGSETGYVAFFKDGVQYNQGTATYRDAGIGLNALGSDLANTQADLDRLGFTMRTGSASGPLVAVFGNVGSNYSYTTPPSGLTASDDQTGQVTVAWSPGTYSQFEVERDSVKIADDDASPYVDTVAPGTYSYRVRGYTNVANSAQTTVSFQGAYPGTVDFRIVGDTLEGVRQDTRRMGWTIRAYNTAGTMIWTTDVFVLEGTLGERLDTGMVANVDRVEICDYQTTTPVRGNVYRNTRSYSAYSNTDSGTSLAPDPDPVFGTYVPEGLTAEGGIRRIDTRWYGPVGTLHTDDTTDSGYELERDGSIVYVGRFPEYADRGLSDGECNDYRVRSFRHDTSTTTTSADFTDTFDRTAAELNGDNGWSAVANGLWEIASGQARLKAVQSPTADGYTLLLRATDNLSKHNVQANLTAAQSGGSALIWGYKSDTDFYYARNNGSTLEVRRYNGSRTILASYSVSNGQQVRIEHDFAAGTISIYHVNNLLGTLSGHTRTVGNRCGIGGFVVGELADNFVQAGTGTATTTTTRTKVNSAWTALVTACTIALPPAPVLSGTTASKQNSLSWTDPAGPEDGFRLYRDGALVWEGTDLSRIDPVALNDVTYCYQVAAYNIAGETLSNTVCLTPAHVMQPPAPARASWAPYLREKWMKHVLERTANVRAGDTGAAVSPSLALISGVLVNEDPINVGVSGSQVLQGLASNGTVLWKTEAAPVVGGIVPTNELVVRLET